MVHTLYGPLCVRVPRGYTRGLHYGVTVVVVVRPWLSTMTKNITWEKD